jgi:glycosyltransferase involved in cell wall biosynthesis
MMDRVPASDSPDAVLGVVVPTHNRPRLLRAALESLARQTCARIRVVVVDEASEPPVSADSFPEGLDVLLIRNDEARGPGAARNIGAAALDTQFVAFLDDDDIYLSRKSAACLAAFDADPEIGTVVHLAVFDGEPFRGSGTAERMTDPLQSWLHGQPPHVDTVVVRKAVHDEVRFDEAFPAAADLDYMIRLAATAPVLMIDEVHAVHGRSPDRQSSISIARRLEGRRRFREKHDALFDRKADAFHWMRTGHLHRRAGERRLAIIAFGRSFFRSPSSAALRGLTLSAVPGWAASALIERERLRPRTSRPR